MSKPHPFHEFPKHLHHASKPAVIAHNSEEETAARDAGYGDEYIHQEYPKHVHGRTVNNAEEEAAAKPQETES